VDDGASAQAEDEASSPADAMTMTMDERMGIPFPA
jgi:hypothetical protein